MGERTDNGEVFRRVVFLDIDGVLNNERWGRRRRSGSSLLDPANVAAVNELCRRAGPGLEFVISSQWRVQMPLEDVVSYLTDDGFEGRIVGATPYLEQVGPDDPETSRGDEVDAWLKEEGFCGGFVVVDDRDDFFPHMDRLARTDFAEGFLPAQIDACLALLDRVFRRESWA